jgi:hypothetical protein
MMAFKLAWLPMPTDDAEALLAWAKRNIQGEESDFCFKGRRLSICLICAGVFPRAS